MKKIILMTLACGTFIHASAQQNKIIQITGSQRTDSSIVVEGFAKAIPSGTVMEVRVESINGNPLNEDRDIIRTIEKARVSEDGSFKAEVKRLGSLDSYAFPDGSYKIRFFAGFSRSWQSIEVARAAGVKLDAQGRSDFGEPRALPPSSDLKLRDALGHKVRFLDAVRTIEIKLPPGQRPRYLTKSAKVELHDSNARNNPVRTMSSTDILVKDLPKKFGPLRPGQSIAIVCRGAFKSGLGYIANDIYLPGARINPEFKVTAATTTMEICHQQEDKNKKAKS